MKRRLLIRGLLQFQRVSQVFYHHRGGMVAFLALKISIEGNKMPL